jgi:hypothetical protein
LQVLRDFNAEEGATSAFGILKAAPPQTTPKVDSNCIGRNIGFAVILIPRNFEQSQKEKK